MNNQPLPHGQIYLHNAYQRIPSRSTPLTILTWNIALSRWYKDVISYLKDIQPDIICLQEVDWGQERTNRANVPAEIAETLGMNYAYATEFEEYWSIRRYVARTPHQAGGVVGNLILSKYTLEDPACIILPQEYMYKGIIPSRGVIHDFRFPLKGPQTALRIAIPFDDGTRLTIYATHLAIMKASMRTRILQYQTIAATALEDEHAIIAGDFNTAAHGAFGIYNFMENIDAFFLKNIFTPEAVYWDKEVIPRTGFVDVYDKQKDWTLKVSPIYKAKLDWILTKGCKTISAEVGPLQYSDHKPLTQKILLN